MNAPAVCKRTLVFENLSDHQFNQIAAAICKRCRVKLSPQTLDKEKSSGELIIEGESKKEVENATEYLLDHPSIRPHT